MRHLYGNDEGINITREIGTTEKILGVHWDPVKDIFKYIYRFPKVERRILDTNIAPTKREVLKVLMTIYDPLGFASCYTIGLIILLQEIWCSGVHWDEDLPQDLVTKWYRWKENLAGIMSLEIPRCYSVYLRQANSVQLHCFVDVGEFGYAAVCYLRVRFGTFITVSMVMAKNKVSPLKPISIPRLELQAAVLGIRMVQKVRQVDGIKVEKCYYWSDSKTVLRWLRMDPRKFRPFVMHRVGEILEHSQVDQWMWIKSKFNPADLATKVNTNIDSSFWLFGPEFLLAEECDWPRCEVLGQEVDTTEVRNCYINVHIHEPHLDMNVTAFSDWRRLYHALATFILYVDKLKASAKGDCKPSIVTNEMVCKAKFLLYRDAQSSAYSEEIFSLKQGKCVEKRSPLKGLDIFLDNDGLLKIRGRTEHLSGYRDVIILPPKHRITFLVVNNAHKQYHHVVHETVVNTIRGQYYIPRLRVLYKRVRRECQSCRNEAASPKVPQMALLPQARLAAFERPFTYTGIDYLVLTKSTERVLYEELERLDKDQLMKSFDGTKWYFNPPAAPHMGGAWERLVRSVKSVLYHAFPSVNFNDETLRGALIEVEYIINSRPLTFVSLESEDDEAITPNHLLLGSATGNKAIFSDGTDLRQKWHRIQAFADRFWKRWVKEYAPVITNHLLLGSATGNKAIFSDGTDLRQKWHRIQAFADRFWKRWVKEYAPVITRRGQWFERQAPIVKGDVVLIVDENLPRNSWLKGIVLETIVARDGQVRRATVRTVNGILQRPASKLEILDVGTRISGKIGEGTALTGGGMLPTADAAEIV
ncbi:uncharacterized protein LOC142234153 [Haematobia irritans]|uniref:uncharacterized protein LOC142234153 n=1 Tax=Haematobia irritans TaxID=7368 RepID=UPI003F509019